MDSKLISEALVLWTGRHIKSWPARDDQRVIDQYGPDVALDLLPVIHRLEAEFYESDARYFAPDLIEMGNQAEERFRSLHPELGEEAIGALGWCYTFDYK
jgi:hypothetical protein